MAEKVATTHAHTTSSSSSSNGVSPMSIDVMWTEVSVESEQV